VRNRRVKGIRNCVLSGSMAETHSTERIFADALELRSPEERRHYLDEVCAGDSDLRRDVESLLEAHEQAGGFLDDATKNVSAGRASTIRIEGAPAPSDEAPKIPGFRIERKLGRGGVGIVYEAWDEKLQRKVALKILHAIPDSETQQRVLGEARKTAALRDPAIVTVHAVLDEHKPPAIVMELVEGFPIDRYAESLTYEQKARILQEIARALGVAHRRGIIHRDLKPANVLLTPAMKPIILDFGLAVSLHEADDLPRHFEGTPLYASPEQVKGEPLSAASDVFSFGSLMFKVLTGRTPFEGADIAEVFRAIYAAQPPFLRDVAVGVPSDLQAICLACLAAKPEDRPTAEEVALDLGRFLAGEPARLRPALYGDILRRRISEYSNDLVNWEHQGIIAADERDRLEVVHRRILADEDHWLVDARRLTLAQTVLYTSTWIVVLASGFIVWLVRGELSPTWRWFLPLFSTGVLVSIGLLAEWRKEALASAAFLAGAVLSLVPTTLALLAEFGLFGVRAVGVQQLFKETFTNTQVLTSCFTALVLSIVALARLRMTGFAWTTCLLGVLAYIGVLLQFNWLSRDPEIRALWMLPLVTFAFVALAVEKVGRVRWALPFHLVAIVVMIVALDCMAEAGPTFAMLGMDKSISALLTSERQKFFSYALNGVLFLLLMLVTENARSLDLRRGSRVFEAAAILHLLGALYANAQAHKTDPHVRLDVGLYLGAVLLFLVLGPWRSRWRMLMGALGGVALGSYLLIDLNLVPKKPFVLSLGAAGLIVALVAYIYLLMAPRPKERRRDE
jgi:serine/threonine protein kinase